MPFQTDWTTDRCLPPTDLGADSLISILFKDCCRRDVWAIHEYALSGLWAIRDSGHGDIAIRNEVLAIVAALPSYVEVVEPDGRPFLDLRTVLMGRLPPGPRKAGAVVFQDEGTITLSGKLVSPFPAYATALNRPFGEVRAVNILPFYRSYFGSVPCDDATEREESNR